MKLRTVSNPMTYLFSPFSIFSNIFFLFFPALFVCLFVCLFVSFFSLSFFVSFFLSFFLPFFLSFHYPFYAENPACTRKKRTTDPLRYEKEVRSTMAEKAAINRRLYVPLTFVPPSGYWVDLHSTFLHKAKFFPFMRIRPFILGCTKSVKYRILEPRLFGSMPSHLEFVEPVGNVRRQRRRDSETDGARRCWAAKNDARQL